MPLDQQLLDYASLSTEKPSLNSELLQYAQAMQEVEEARKRYLRDKYVWGLASEFSGQRKKYLDQATEEISDPIERQFLANEVVKVRKAMEWVERGKYQQSGFAGKFIRNIGKVGEKYVEAGAGILEAAKDIAKYTAGFAPKKEDVEFRQAIDYANLSQDFQLSGYRGVAQKAAEGMAGMAPDMAGGLLAGSAAGPTGMFAYWTARQAPHQIRQYTSMGVDPTTATLAGYGTAGLSAAIELFNYDPTGLTGEAKRGLVSGATKAATRIAKEAIEEPAQAVTESGLQYFVGKLYPNAKGPEFMDVASAPGYAVKETLPALVGIGISGGAGMHMRVLETEAIENEVIKASNDGKPISRSQYKRWGLGDEEMSQEERTEKVLALSESIKSRDQAECVVTRTPPTEQQWLDWQFPKELGLTPEDRLREVDTLAMAGAAIEAREIAPDATSQAFVGTEGNALAGAASQQAAVQGRLQPDGEVDLKRIRNIEDNGNLIEDESGNLGVKVDQISGAVQRGFKQAKHLYKKFVTSKGELPQEAFDLTVQRDARFSRHQAQIGFLLAETNRALKAVYGDVVLGEDERQLLSGYLQGKRQASEIPEPLRGPLNKMRDQIDSLTRLAIEDGVAQGELAIVMDENQGMYVTRGYRVFDDSSYALKIPQEIRNKAIALLREWYPEKSEAQIHGLVAHLLYEGKAADRVFPQVSSSKLKSKDLSILKKRILDEMPELRALYGEYDDPRLQYARTVTKLGNLIAQHRFLTDLRAAGLEQGFFSSSEDGPTINQFGELKVRIAADQSTVLYPLNGLYTTPEIRDALLERSGDMPDWLRVYMLSNTIVKTAKTILSPMTHVRNAVANVWFAVQNGHWRVGKAGIAFKAVVSDFQKKATPEMEGYVLRAIELGILHEEVNAGELRDYVRDFDKYNDFDDFAYDTGNRRQKATIRLARKSANAMVDLYRLEDAFWKIYAFENEKARYRKAIPALSEMSEEELEQRAAKIVRDTYPTYSLVPLGVKRLRRFPITGTFVSFPAEVIRTTKNSLKLSMEEMADPRLRKIGASRFTGNLLAFTGTPSIAITSMFLAGVSRSEDEDLRKFLAPYQRNSILVHFGKTKDGKYRILDLSYSDPHSILKKPFMAFMRGEDLGSSLDGALAEAAEPFFGMEILAGALIGAYANEGQSVRNQADSDVKQSLDTSRYIWDKSFKPGAVSMIERIAKGIKGEKSRSGYAYNPYIETIAHMSGQRFQDIDVAQSLTYRIKDFKTGRRFAHKQLSDVTHNRGSVNQNEVINAYVNSENSRRQLYEEHSRVISAARRLQVADSDLFSILKGEQLSKVDMYSLLNGVYIPRTLSKEFYQSMHDANPDEYASRAEAISKAVQILSQNPR